MIAKKTKIKKKRNFKKVISTALISIGLMVLVGFMLFSGLKIREKRTEMAGEIDRLKKEIDLLTNENEQLEENLFQAESDSFLKARLYEQGYKEPGEEMIVVVPPEKKEEPVLEEEKSFWQNFWEKIKNF
jgi:cell division protein FtsB